jgi:pimeloyl-ACP methyl ester carboxylesterase
MFKFFSTFVFATLIASAAPFLFHVQVSGHGKPMILIPGLSSSGEVWNSTVDRFAKDYECHVLTLAGFAGQPAQANFSLAGVESDVSAYIAANKLGRPVVVGHSLGGFIALSLAAHHPDQVSALIIVDSLPAMGAAGNPTATSKDLADIANKMKAGMSAITNDERLKTSRSYVESMVTAPADLDRIDNWSKASDWPTVVTALSEMMGTDLRHEVKKISAPTIVLGTWVAFAQYGGEPAVKKTFDTQFAELNGVKIVLAPKARHFIMYDDPQWMFAQMDDFLTVRQAAR